MKALKIDVLGFMELVDITGSTVEEQNDCIWEILGGYFDIIRIPWGAVMLVDDEGILKGLPDNPVAARIAGYPVIAGTALITGIEDTPDGEVFTDCPEHYTDYA